MRRWALFAAAFAAFAVALNAGFDPARPDRVGLAASAEARGRSTIHFSFFFDSLRPYGHWAKYRPYGWVFVPRVALGWRPYTLGRWVYSRHHGWLWVSDEPFGWAAYHYGWWDYDPRWGWFWVPGYDWAPSWVIWRIGIDFIGWAPIPARYVWGRPYHDIFSHWDDRYWRHTNAWCFTRKRHIGARHASQVIVPVQQNVTYITQSTVVHNTTIVNQTIVNRGIDVALLERNAGASVPRAEVNALDVPPARATAREGPQGLLINAFMPDPGAAVVPTAVAAEPESQPVPEAVAALAPVLEPTVPGPMETRPDNRATGAITPKGVPEQAITPSASRGASEAMIEPEPEPGEAPPAEASLPPASVPAREAPSEAVLLPETEPLPEPPPGAASPPEPTPAPEPAFEAVPEAPPFAPEPSEEFIAAPVPNEAGPRPSAPPEARLDYGERSAEPSPGPELGPTPPAVFPEAEPDEPPASEAALAPSSERPPGAALPAQVESDRDSTLGLGEERFAAPGRGSFGTPPALKSDTASPAPEPSAEAVSEPRGNASPSGWQGRPGRTPDADRSSGTEQGQGATRAGSEWWRGGRGQPLSGLGPGPDAEAEAVQQSAPSRAEPARSSPAWEAARQRMGTWSNQGAAPREGAAPAAAQKSAAGQAPSRAWGAGRREDPGPASGASFTRRPMRVEPQDERRGTAGTAGDGTPQWDRNSRGAGRGARTFERSSPARGSASPTPQDEPPG